MLIAEVRPAPPGSQSALVAIRGGASMGKGQISHRHDKTALLLTRDQCRKMGLSYGERIGLWYRGNVWRIGPYLGIMTSKRPGNRSGFSGLKGRRENYVALLRLGKGMGVTGFVFAYEDINFATLRVTGYSQGKDKKWYARDYPLPDVIYNRISDRPTERSASASAAIKRLERLAHTRGIHMFNPHFLDKWELYKILMKEVELRPHLPKTVLYRSPRDIENALSESSMVYLKPRNGFAGKGIMRASCHRDGYTLSVKRGEKYVRLSMESKGKLLQEFQRNRSPGAYLVQQGLTLARFRGAIFDARVIVQKNGTGEWDISGVGVRVAAKGGITTHVPNGGYIAPLETVLTEVFGGKESAVVQQRIRTLALQVAKCIEGHYHKPFGELSMDIGLDKEGRCFFFEANAKPMKFDEPQIRKVTLRRLLEYSRFLAGYRKDAEQEAKNVLKKDNTGRTASV